MFWFWVFEKKRFFEWFWPGPLKRLPMYLFHKGSGLNIVRIKAFWKMIFFFFWENFEMKTSLLVTGTGPLKKLPMYLSHRGSGLDVVWKKSFEKSFEKWIFYNESFFFFFWKESSSIRMIFFLNFIFFKWTEGDPLNSFFDQS